MTAQDLLQSERKPFTLNKQFCLEWAALGIPDWARSGEAAAVDVFRVFVFRAIGWLLFVVLAMK